MLHRQPRLLRQYLRVVNCCQQRVDGLAEGSTLAAAASHVHQPPIIRRQYCPPYRLSAVTHLRATNGAALPCSGPQSPTLWPRRQQLAPTSMKPHLRSPLRAVVRADCPPEAQPSHRVRAPVAVPVTMAISPGTPTTEIRGLSIFRHRERNEVRWSDFPRAAQPACNIFQSTRRCGCALWADELDQPMLRASRRATRNANTRASNNTIVVGSTSRRAGVPTDLQRHGAD